MRSYFYSAILLDDIGACNKYSYGIVEVGEDSDLDTPKKVFNHLRKDIVDKDPLATRCNMTAFNEV